MCVFYIGDREWRGGVRRVSLGREGSEGEILGAC